LQTFDPKQLVGMLVGVGVGLLIAQAFGRQRRLAQRERALRELERKDADAALAKSRRELQDVSNRTNELASAFQFLPDVIRQLFTASGLRTIGPLAVNLVDQLFRPDQAALFVARPSRKRLALAGGKGVPATVKVGSEVEYGVGRIGYSALQHAALDEQDVKSGVAQKAARQMDLSINFDVSGLHGVRAEVVAPITDGNELLGVVCMAGNRMRIGQEKKLLSMVADLTAVALVHANRLKASEEAGNLDGLTGVLNKRTLLERLDQAVQKAKAEGAVLSLLVVDLDHFEEYNRSNGNLQGDEVLKRLADILKGSVRESDLVGRFGGEEFIVVFVGAGKELAMRLSEKLRQAVEGFAFPHRQHQPLGAITISGGVASFPDDSRNVETLIRCADQALFEAKSAGRNRVFPGEPNFLA